MSGEGLVRQFSPTVWETWPWDLGLLAYPTPWREAAGITGPAEYTPVGLPGSRDRCGPWAVSGPPGLLQTYRSQVLSILQEAAARESRHRRWLLR